MSFSIFLIHIIGLSIAGEKMIFPSVERPTFNQHQCSPPHKETKPPYLDFNIPKQITWGESFPICAFFKVEEDKRGTFLDVNIEIQGVTNTNVDGVGEISFYFPDPENEQARKLLEKQGYLFFNINGLSEFRNPPPGRYTLLVKVYGTASAAKKEFQVIAGGKRLELATVFIKEVCEADLLGSFKPYIKLREKMNLVDLSPEGVEKFEKLLDAATAEGQLKHQKIFSTIDKKWLSTVVRNESKALVHYIANEVSKTCPTLAKKYQGKLDSELWYILDSMR